MCSSLNADGPSSPILRPTEGWFLAQGHTTQGRAKAKTHASWFPVRKRGGGENGQLRELITGKEKKHRGSAGSRQGRAEEGGAQRRRTPMSSKVSRVWGGTLRIEDGSSRITESENSLQSGDSPAEHASQHHRLQDGY